MKTNSFDEKRQQLNALSIQIINLTININDLKKQQDAIIACFKELHSEVAQEVQNLSDSSSPDTEPSVEP